MKRYGCRDIGLPEYTLAYGFSEISDALARIHGVSDEKRAAFVGRLQHLQKRKFPPGLNTGRGRAASYESHHLFLLAVMLELNQFGLGPEQGEDLIEEGIGELALGVMRITDRSRPDDDEPVFCDVPAWHLDGLGKKKPFSRGLSVFPLSSMKMRLEGYGRRDALIRLSVFSLSALVNILPLSIAPSGEPREEFLRELRQWAQGPADEFETRVRRKTDIALLRRMGEEANPHAAQFAEAVGLRAEWEIILGDRDGHDS